MKNQILLCSLIILTGMFSCLGGGTHGSTKYYQYNVSKQILETAVQSVIKESNVLKQDSIKGDCNNDSTYVTMYITYGSVSNEYTFRYGGNKEYWDTSETSSISIAYAYNKNHKGGSEGNGGVKLSDVKLRKELTEPFEKEFISKIDSELGIKHTSE
jgi:hypothetical protein